jgi:ribosomal protein S1
VKNIQLWAKYDGFVKLIYNYGIFVTVNGVEGLLHKNFIAPLWNGVEWKKFYNIWDKITVIAKEFKDVEWEKKVVWTQFA